MKKIILCLLILVCSFSLFAVYVPSAPIVTAKTVHEGELLFGGTYHALIKTGDINLYFTYYLKDGWGVMTQIPLYCFKTDNVDHFYLAGYAVKRLGSENLFGQLGLGYVVFDYNTDGKSLRLRGPALALSLGLGLCEEVMLKVACSEWFLWDFNTEDFYPNFNASLAIGLRF